jgi:SAM-dependent methyltransferase
MKTIEYIGKHYPALQADGNAAQFAIPFAKKILSDCKVIADVGCNRPEWSYPNSVMVDLSFDDGYHAMNLPDMPFDAIFSSHFLEHYVGRFQDVIEYWLGLLPDGGLIFLYLPNMDEQDYWAFGNKKHIHHLTPELMHRYCSHLASLGLISTRIISEGADLNSSFYCVIEK